MGGSSTPGTTTATTTPPLEIFPAHMQLIDSALAASRQAAGQQPNYLRSTPQFFSPSAAPFSPYSQGFMQQPQQPAFAPGAWQQPQQQQAAVQPQGFAGGNVPQQGQAQAPRQGGQPLQLTSGQYGTVPGQGGWTGAGAVPIPPGQVPGQASPGGFPIQVPGPLTQAAGEPIVGQQFPGPFIAPANLLELESLAGREAVGRELGGVGAGVMNLGQYTTAGGFLDPSTNPWLQAAMGSAIQPQLEAYERVFAPQLASAGIQAGAFKGSSARRFADQALMQDVASNIQNTVSEMAFQNLARERELQQQAPMLIDAAARLQQLSPEILAQVGAGIRSLEQQQIDNAILQLQEQIEGPFRPLMPLASIIHGGDIGSTQILQQPQPSAALRGITGAIGGASVGSQVGGQIGQGYPGWGAGLGGLLGGLGSAFA